MTPRTRNGSAPNTAGGEEITALKRFRQRKPLMRIMLHPTGHDPCVAITSMEITPGRLELTG